MKVITVIGTRPEIIKLSPLIPMLDEQFEHTFVFSGQHYSKNMVQIFLDQMQVRQPDIFLQVDSSDVGSLEKALTKEFEKLDGDIVLVYGDTNSTIAAARSIKEGMKLVHIEAGIRSFDLRMPEERNRIETDKLSHLMLPPTGLAKYFLTDYEGYSEDKIEVVGNLVVAAYFKYKDQIDAAPLPENIEPESYCLMTLHRTENVDDPVRFDRILKNIAKLNCPVVFPVHPRTQKRMEEYGISFPSNVVPLEAMGYFEFMRLLSECKVVITDSGGVQEEAITVGVPCITVREDTERMETVFLGASVLYDAAHRMDMDVLVEEMAQKREYIRNLKNPYGDKTSPQLVIDACLKHFN